MDSSLTRPGTLKWFPASPAMFPKQMGPAEQMVDATLLDESGNPLVMYQGIDGLPANLNIVYNEGSLPTLVPLKERENPGQIRLTPVNLVSRWYWASGDSQEPIAREVLQQALMNNGQFRPELVDALDQNHDGKLSRAELKLDTRAKRQVVEQLLVAAGVKNPTIRSDVKFNKISHGVTGRSQALSDCGACHGPDSRLKDSLVLASWSPGGKLPPGRTAGPSPGAWKPPPTATLCGKTQAQANLHLLGSGNNWSDRLGVLMLLGVVLGVTVHGGYRLISRRRYPPHVLKPAGSISSPLMSASGIGSWL